MTYTEFGLKIDLIELEWILKKAIGQSRDGMEPVIYIEGGEKPKIKQYPRYRGKHVEYTLQAK